MTGRATRGFVAFNMSSKRLCFLKDYWRPVSIRIHSELDVYKRFKETNVNFVATVIGGGDVEDGTSGEDSGRSDDEGQSEDEERAHLEAAREGPKQHAPEATRLYLFPVGGRPATASHDGPDNDAFGRQQ